MTPPINIDGTQITGATIDGQDVSEITVDGTPVFSVIPESALNLLDFEDSNNDTTVAADINGSIDADINGPSFTSTAAVGSQALDHPSKGDRIVSQSTVDLAAKGNSDAVGLAVFINPDSGQSGDFAGAASWGADGDNYINIVGDGSGNWEFFAEIGGSRVTLETNTAINFSNYQHVVMYLTQSEIGGFVDNTDQGTKSHSLDPTQIGAGTFRTSHSFDFAVNSDNLQGLYDEFATLVDEPTSGEVDTLFNR